METNGIYKNNYLKLKFCIHFPHLLLVEPTYNPSSNSRHPSVLLICELYNSIM